MTQPIPPTNPPADPELFPYNWLISTSVWGVITAAPVGICLLSAQRAATPHSPGRVSDTGTIADFQYVFLNPVQEAMIKLAADDVVGQPLTMISPDVDASGVLDRLRQVADTGQPTAHTEAYHLDGIAGLFHQVYLKSGDGVLVLTQDVSYQPLSVAEQQQQVDLLTAIHSRTSVASIRARLISLMSGQLS
ncbi:PAS domain-containing protein [Fibrella aquatilis]|uniref:PAS domain-containing protein n=1 Tax=Fibrella aquatilis TaxID=2817059 RepID=A0A939G4G1_9BACT|nr:PAS domain-containing protein [Fibrella aquatilis]MBO0929628.1 PAS domain-containing protein [Fibrella aquatilis]